MMLNYYYVLRRNNNLKGSVLTLCKKEKYFQGILSLSQ